MTDEDQRDRRDNDDTDGFIPPHGGYLNLRSYRKAEIVYDATDYFCARFLEKRDRTYDQMVQAARSGKQNIIGLIKLTNFLLDRQIKSLEQTFLQKGGMRERMAEARRQARRKPRQNP